MANHAAARTANPLAGIFWMIVTGGLFVALSATVKVLGGTLPPAEAAFLRYVIGLAFVVPMLPALRHVRIDRRTFGMFGVRGLAHAIGLVLWFYSMTVIPLVEVTALHYLSPLGVTVLAVLVLKERMEARRILAITAALAGTALILRPGFREVSPGHIAMLGTAAMFSVSYFMAKLFADRFAPPVVVALLSIVVTAALAPFALAVWTWPTWTELGLCALLAVFATAGHYTMTVAFSHAPLTTTQPVMFLQLVWASLLGAFAFGEPPDVFVIAGGLAILASVVFITWCEAASRRGGGAAPSGEAPP